MTARPQPDESLDLTGVPCPRNAAEALLELEMMDEGQVLELIIDDGEPLENVPESLVVEGHRVVARESRGATWVLLVRRGAD